MTVKKRLALWVGKFFVHEPAWTVTHEPSGRIAAVANTRGQARGIAALLDASTAIYRWSFGADGYDGVRDDLDLAQFMFRYLVRSVLDDEEFPVAREHAGAAR